jgi:hypothetical protein
LSGIETLEWCGGFGAGLLNVTTNAIWRKSCVRSKPVTIIEPSIRFLCFIALFDNGRSCFLSLFNFLRILIITGLIDLLIFVYGHLSSTSTPKKQMK